MYFLKSSSFIERMNEANNIHEKTITINHMEKNIKQKKKNFFVSVPERTHSTNILKYVCKYERCLNEFQYNGFVATSQSA